MALILVVLRRLCRAIARLDIVTVLMAAAVLLFAGFPLAVLRVEYVKASRLRQERPLINLSLHLRISRRLSILRHFGCLLPIKIFNLRSIAFGE